MIDVFSHSLFALAVITVIGLTVVARILIRSNRDPASRIAWIVVVASLPLLGALAYLLLGEVNIGRKRAQRMRAVIAGLPPFPAHAVEGGTRSATAVPDRYRHLFRLGHSISGFHPIGGNAARLMPDSDATIDAMVQDIDAATDHVHLLFYIWLTDHSGRKIVDALTRAAGRGVTCRAMADGLGSRFLIRSAHWQAMRQAGVQVAACLPVGNPLLRPFDGRIDLRNHRKIVVIDDRITYCGSQNCADAEFLVKAAYAPWVDAVMRFEGPIARQNQFLFAGDWMSCVDDEFDALLRLPLPSGTPDGVLAQVIGTGPTMRASAMPELFASLLFTAQREVVVTTPYYVPNESLQSALCTAAYRGVDITIVFTARNDSWVVAAASRSYYADLLAAGVKVYEYEGGVLHTKSLTLDGEVTLIGSANMDRRSFELNYENNILFADRPLTQTLRARQQHYIAHSRQVTCESVAAWPLRRRLWNNLIATLGPVL